MEIKIKKLHPDAKIPEYATDGSGAFDLFCVQGDMPYGSHTLYSSTTKAFKTGLAFEIPKDHVMLVFSRSGHGFKHDTRLANCVGVIDSDYRGELMVKLSKDPRDTAAVTIKEHDAIAQAMIIKAEQVKFKVVDDLSDTERGEGGFGSTDKA